MLTLDQEAWLRSLFGIDVKQAEVKGAKTEDVFLHRKRGEDYEGEESELGFRAGKLEKGATEKEIEQYKKSRAVKGVSTKMYTDEERADHTVSVSEEGTLTDKDDREVSGEFIYSVDADTGEMVLGKEHSSELIDKKTGKVVQRDMVFKTGAVTAIRSKGALEFQPLHHSSLVQAGDVAGAGTINLRGGKVKSISNTSGHYKPRFEHLLQVIESLLASGLLLNQDLVDFTGARVSTDSPAFKLHEKVQPMLKDLKKDQGRVAQIVKDLASETIEEEAEGRLQKELDKLLRKTDLVNDALALLRKMGIGASNKLTQTEVVFNFASSEGTGADFVLSADKKSLPISDFVMGEGSKKLESLEEEDEADESDDENAKAREKYLDRVGTEEEDEDEGREDSDDEDEGRADSDDEDEEDEDDREDEDEADSDDLPKERRPIKKAGVTRDATGRNEMLEELKEVARKKGLRPEDRSDMPEGTVSKGAVPKLDTEEWEKDIGKLMDNIVSFETEDDEVDEEVEEEEIEGELRSLLNNEDEGGDPSRYFDTNYGARKGEPSRYAKFDRDKKTEDD